MKTSLKKNNKFWTVALAVIVSISCILGLWTVVYAQEQKSEAPTKNEAVQTEVEVNVRYIFEDEKVFKEEKIKAEKGQLIDSGDLPMLPDDMKFIDEFLFYEVKGDGKDEIIRKVAKIEVKDKGTQTELSKDDVSKIEKEAKELQDKLDKLNCELKDKDKLSDKQKNKIKDLEDEIDSLKEKMKKDKGNKDLSEDMKKEIDKLTEKVKELEKKATETNKAPVTSQSVTPISPISGIKTSSGISPQTPQTSVSSTGKGSSDSVSSGNTTKDTGKGKTEVKEKEKEIRYPNKLTAKMPANNNSQDSAMDGTSKSVNTNKGVASAPSKARGSLTENKDNANKEHALKEIGSVKFSNLCTEIMQLSEVSDINSYFEEDVIRRGISCNLGSLNIATVMENKRIREATRAAIDSLTTVSDLTNIDVVPSIKKANEELHSVGLGAMNLHGYFAKNFIMYESREALDFCNVFFMMVNFYSLERSMEIAREKGETFKDFDKSEYANGNYFNKYLENEYLPQTDKVKELFEGIHIPTQDDWARLKEDVMKYGVYNAYRMAIAPNQSTSYIMNSTASIMPVVDTIEVREYGDSTTFYPMPYLTNDNYFFYKSAYDMDQKNILKLVSVIQRHVDQGISTILFNKSTDTTRDLAKLYIYAHRLGLKSLYYTRTRKATIEECISCSV